MTEQLIIHWKSKETGLAGNGQPISAIAARDKVEELNRDYAGRIHHWTEPAGVLSAQVPGAGFMGEAS